VTAFIRTRGYVGLGGVVAFLLLCGAISPNTARADAPLSLIRQVATIYAAPTVIDNPFDRVLTETIHENGYVGHWRWNDMQPFQPVRWEWASIRSVLRAVMRCESRMDPWAVGDKGKSRGLWQIHSGYNPTVSDSEAFGIRSSTRWAVQRILRGEGYKWSCFRGLQW